jgi:hypothetical protein
MIHVMHDTRMFSDTSKEVDVFEQINK